jgi:hypothetical protein
MKNSKLINKENLVIIAITLLSMIVTFLFVVYFNYNRIPERVKNINPGDHISDTISENPEIKLSPKSSKNHPWYYGKIIGDNFILFRFVFITDINTTQTGIITNVDYRKGKEILFLDLLN